MSVTSYPFFRKFIPYSVRSFLKKMIVPYGPVVLFFPHLFAYAFGMFSCKRPGRKFVILAQGRTGSTLLVDLLNSNPCVRCDGEILGNRTWFPLRYVKGRSNLSRKNAYGFKVKIEHLTEVHRMQDPGKFLQKLHRDGWKVIHLKRENFLRQVLSNIRAEQLQKYNPRKSDPVQKSELLHVDCNRLHKGLGRRAYLSALEVTALCHLPHITVVYESDLIDPEKQQDTLNKIFDFLDVPCAPVSTDLVRTGGDRIQDMVVNYNDVAGVVENTPYAWMLDEDRDPQVNGEKGKPCVF